MLEAQVKYVLQLKNAKWFKAPAWLKKETSSHKGKNGIWINGELIKKFSKHINSNVGRNFKNLSQKFESIL